jgi:hypothetical protein
MTGSPCCAAPAVSAGVSTVTVATTSLITSIAANLGYSIYFDKSTTDAITYGITGSVLFGTTKYLGLSTPVALGYATFGVGITFALDQFSLSTKDIAVKAYNYFMPIEQEEVSLSGKNTQIDFVEIND